MSGRRTNSWGDPIHFSQTSAAGQEYPGPSPHAEMSWTVCYDDDCEIHLCEKQGSGWFPRRKQRKGPKRGKGKGKFGRRDLEEDDPENKPWGDGGDGGGCPIPTEGEVKAILARKAAREAEEAKAEAAARVNREVQIGREEEEAKPNTKITQGVKPKATTEVKSDWAEKIRELLAGGEKADRGACSNNNSKPTNNSLAEAVVKPVPPAGNPTPAVAKYGPLCGKGQFASTNRRSTVASASFNSVVEKKQFSPPPPPPPPVTTAPAAFDEKLVTPQPIATAKTPQRTHFTYPHTTTTTPAAHSPTIDKKQFTTPPPVATIRSPAIFDPRLEKKQFPPLPTANHHQKQPLQPRKDQGKTNPHPKPSKVSHHQNSPVTTFLPTVVIAARAAAKAKLAAEREEKLSHMAKYRQVIGTGTGVA